MIPQSHTNSPVPVGFSCPDFTMDHQSKEELKEILKEMTPWGRINFSQVLQSILVIGLVGLYVKLDVTGQDIALSKQSDEVIQADLQELKARIDNFAAQPRITNEQLRQQLSPFMMTLESIQKTQEEIQERLSESERNDRELRRELDQIKQQIRVP